MLQYFILALCRLNSGVCVFNVRSMEYGSLTPICCIVLELCMEKKGGGGNFSLRWCKCMVFNTTLSCRGMSVTAGRLIKMEDTGVLGEI